METFVAEIGSSSVSSARRHPAASPGEAGVAPAGDDPPSPRPDAAPGCPGCRVHLLLEIEEPVPPLTGWLDAELARLAPWAGAMAGEVRLAIVDDARMTELHERYRQDATTTDVLSFDLRDEADEPIDGDLVICFDEAQRQAAQRGHDTRLEILLYAVHGLLHFLGEDDHDPADAQRMHQREDELLIRAGFGPVYGR